MCVVFEGRDGAGKGGTFGADQGRANMQRHWCSSHIDTYQDALHDIYDWPGGPAVEGPNYTVQARSLVGLFALGGNGPCLAGGVVLEGLS